MEINEYKNYNIANISEEDLKAIVDLEKRISSKTHEEVVLIAYNHNSHLHTYERQS